MYISCHQLKPSNSKFKEHIVIIITIIIINGTYKARNFPKNSERTKDKKNIQKPVCIEYEIPKAASARPREPC